MFCNVAFQDVTPGRWVFKFLQSFNLSGLTRLTRWLNVNEILTTLQRVVAARKQGQNRRQ